MNDQTVALDDFTKLYLAEQQAALQATTQSMQTALQLFIRRSKLEGQWRLSQDGQSIERVDSLVPSALPPSPAELSKINGNRTRR